MKSEHWAPVYSTIAMAAIFASPTSYAQQAAPSETLTAAPETIGEIIVTAQKRSERLSDVPLSITAAAGDQLARQGITDVAQLEKIVPGFTYQNSSYGTPIFSIRGVGFYDTSIGASPAVSIYLDQVPLPYSSMARGVSFDLERVEALKGPQGTLFGQNSTGGAINYIAAKPTKDTTEGFDLDYGRFNSVNMQAFVSGRLAPNLQARIAARYEYRDAWQIGYAPNDTKFGESGNNSLGKRRFNTERFLLDWTPTGKLSFEFDANGWVDNSDTQANRFVSFAPIVAPNPFNATTYNAFLGSAPLRALPNNARLAGWDGGQDHGRDDHFYQFSLNGALQINDTTKLTSITAYSNYHENSLTDVDGTAYSDLSVNRVASIESYSQELRLSGFEDPVRWLVGGNYAHDASDERQTQLLGTSNNGVGPFRYDAVQLRNQQTVRTAAGFGDLDYSLTNQLTLQASARYTKQNRDFAGCLADAGNGQLATAFGTIFVTPTSPGNCVTMASPTKPVLLPIVDNTLDQSNVSWRGSINWKPTIDALLYTSVSKGYKAGSFPVLPGVFATQFRPVTQESLLAYETGFKTALANHRVQLTGALFYYDYSNKQVLGSAYIPPFGNLPQLVNIPKSRVEGAELEATIRPTEGLRLSVGVTYVDSRVLENPSNPVDAFGVPTTFVGEAFPNSPRWQGVGDAEYRFAAGAGRMLFVGGSVTERSSSYAVFGHNPQMRINGYGLLDLRAGVEAENGSWRVELWGRNVTNKFYVINVAHIIDDVTNTAGMPVTYGVSFSYRH
jgi:iron complex outermembrane recepter protein